MLKSNMVILFLEYELAQVFPRLTVERAESSLKHSCVFPSLLRAGHVTTRGRLGKLQFSNMIYQEGHIKRQNWRCFVSYLGM